MQVETPIREIMTTALTTVSPDTPVKKIQQLFAANSFHHLPVVEAGSQLVGIISREDFRTFYEQLSTQSSGPTWSHIQIEHKRAKDMMTASPLCLDPDDTIGLAADIFLANKFHALPVVEDGLLMGLLTSHDILAYLVGASKLDNNAVSL